MYIHVYNIHVELSAGSTCGAKTRTKNEAPPRALVCAILLTSASFAVLMVTISMYKGWQWVLLWMRAERKRCKRLFFHDLLFFVRSTC